MEAGEEAPDGVRASEVHAVVHELDGSSHMPHARSAALVSLAAQSWLAEGGAIELPHGHARRRKNSHLDSLSPAARGQLLIEASEHKDSVEVLRLHLEGGADVHAVDVHSRTALFWCALLGNAEGARTLLFARADPQRADENGWLPRDIARALGHNDVAAVISESVEELALLSVPGTLWWAASVAAEDVGFQLVSKLTGDNGEDGSGKADLDECTSPFGRSAVHYAAMFGKCRILRALLAAGAAVHVRDATGHTPAMWAAVTGHTAALRCVLEWLPSSGTEEPEDLEEAAELAARNGNAHALRILLLHAAVDPARLFRASRRAMVALMAALEPHELCRCVVVNARCAHPLVLCLQASAALERMHMYERSRDADSAAHMHAASAMLERVACALVRTGPSRSALLDTKLCADGRTAIELSVDLRRKKFLHVPVVQQYIDKIWYQGGVVFHATRKAGRIIYALTCAAAFLFSPFILLASWAGSALALDLEIVYAPLERYAAKELLFFAFMVYSQFLRRVQSEPATAAQNGYEGSLAIWLLGIWVGEMQHIIAARRAEAQRVGLVREIWSVSTAGWKGIDAVTVTYALVTGAVRIATHVEHSETLAEVEMRMRAIAYLCLWLRFVRVLSVFSFTGPLVQMIIQMFVHDLLRWAFIQVLVLVSFASALSALFSGMNEADVALNEAGIYAFGSMGDAMKTLTEITVGTDEPWPERTWGLVANSGLGWAILFGYQVITSLLLMNLLIALLTHTVDTIRNRNVIEYTYGRCYTALLSRTLPVIPPPLNLVHLLFQLIGAVLTPPLRLCGWRPPSVAMQQRSKARSARMKKRDMSLLGHAAAKVMNTGAKVWRAGVTAVVGDSLSGPSAHGERSSGGDAIPGWVRPSSHDMQRMYNLAWEDLLADDQHLGPARGGPDAAGGGQHKEGNNAHSTAC